VKEKERGGSHNLKWCYDDMDQEEDSFLRVC